MILLDTHSLLWFINGDARMGSTIKQAILDSETTVFVSTASLWEISIKLGIKKLSLGFDWNTLLEQHITGNGFGVLEILASHVQGVQALPHHHRDLFDRLLIAQALEEQLQLVTSDDRIKPYAVPQLDARA